MLDNLITLELIGYLAAFCTTFSFFPQALKTLKSKDTSGLSLIMYMVFVSGVSLWAIYGFIIGDTALIIANLFTGILAFSILVIIIQNQFSRSLPKNPISEP